MSQTRSLVQGSDCLKTIPVRVGLIVAAGEALSDTQVGALREGSSLLGNAYPSPEFVALADVSANATSETASRLGCRKFYADWRALLDDPEVNLVAVSAPLSSRAEIATAAARAGKHVYCETPLGISAEEAQAVWSAAKVHYGIVHLASYPHLRHPALERVKEIIASGEIGEVVRFHGIFNPGVPDSGVMNRPFDGMASVAQKLLGKTVAVYALPCSPVRVAHLEAHARGPNLTAANRTRLGATFVNGAVGLLETAPGAALAMRYEVHGTTGVVIYDQKQMDELRVSKTDGRHCNGDDPGC
jgi:predicted dehydrogenase